MKYVYVNLKRFDILRSLNGVNDYAIGENGNWAKSILEKLNDRVSTFSPLDYEFVFFFPEAYLIPAIETLNLQTKIKIGCQSIHFHDSSERNIGAYTSFRPASAMTSINIRNVIIGHSEERVGMMELLESVSSNSNRNKQAIHHILQNKIALAQNAGMDVLYCIGESLDERDKGIWKAVLADQLSFDNKKVDVKNIKIAYEPIWAIGHHRPVPTVEMIDGVAEYVHSLVGADTPLLYGGGLKEENAEQIAAIRGISGGLIALTNFTGHIGFYPDQFVHILQKYTNGVIHK
ncbi:MAG: triose-phosphate isomerase [Sporolactobacillus sp.]|jgi:triosephosphate isomerase|nr:triose-phosphate isomerase [Sporolactobacillus sp.]